ncbi:hypothetical protein Poly51_60330 [Rubripirellula tenax]|uniref:Uncharacterized protein n=1 Tax=Rubripirellula tenax TaxID=2528015 RepID=A0A5C6E6N4_9BACT|nr:hypothetical protein Poly51_60330 [Rubripirellula tenax]
MDNWGRGEDSAIKGTETVQLSGQMLSIEDPDAMHEDCGRLAKQRSSLQFVN